MVKEADSKSAGVTRTGSNPVADVFLYGDGGTALELYFLFGLKGYLFDGLFVCRLGYRWGHSDSR